MYLQLNQRTMPKVLSTMRGILASCATYRQRSGLEDYVKYRLLTLASSGILFTEYLGFAMLSTKIPRVFSSMAAAKSFGSVEVTNFTFIPKVGKVTLVESCRQSRLYVEDMSGHTFELVETLKNEECQPKLCKFWYTLFTPP